MPTGAGTAPSRRSGMLANRKLSYQSFGAGDLTFARSGQEIAYHWLAQPVLIVLVDCSARFTPAGSEV